MPYFRSKFLICAFAFLVIFFVFILWQELVVLDKFEYISVNNESLSTKCDCESYKQQNDDEIDLVYTWVNGSDLRLKSLIRLYQQLNRTDEQQCKDIIETPFLLTIPQMIPSTYNKLISKTKNSGKAEWLPIEYKIDNDISSSLFYFEDKNKAQEYLIKKPHFLYNYRLHQLYFSTQKCKLTKDEFTPIKLKNVFKIDKRLIDESTKSRLFSNLSKALKLDNSKLIKYKFDYENFEVVAIDSRYDVNGLDTLATEYSKYRIEFGNQEFHFKLITRDLKLSSSDDAYGENRFSDKDELKYSLRSVEKYANWVRNIYIVTNGQVPSWLNTSNPQIHIVHHQQIYTNQSHLPTFNSASIECHLHRIKGLSKRFLYMNDDFMFGKEVFLEDFYSRSKGYQIRMGWSAPNCARNCPTSWLQDGICDKSCNTSMCLFDGGDCLNDEKNTSESATSSRENTSLLNVCKFDCPTNWLADGHCDSQCDNAECGFDLGDCRISNIETVLQGISFSDNQTEYKFNLTEQQKGVYLNMTNHLIKLRLNKKLNNIELKASNETHIKKYKFSQRTNLIFILLNHEQINTNLYFNLTLKLNSKTVTNSINLVISFRPSISTSRKLMDFYADSLSYSNYIINKKYSIQNRKVPAHMPILLAREILERMNIDLYDEIQETSSHRFRNSQDLQFAFTYFYFLMSEQFYPTLDQIVNEFDSNQDSKLNRNEARSFFLASTENQFEEKDFNKFWNESLSCSKSKDEDQVSIATLVNCIDFDFLSNEIKVKKRNKFVTLKMDDVSFHQIGNDVNQFQAQLDKVRKSPTQFICVNDNYSYRDPKMTETVKQILYDFYESILPLKSGFELDFSAVERPSVDSVISANDEQQVYASKALFIFILFSASICMCSRLLRSCLCQS